MYQKWKSRHYNEIKPHKAWSVYAAMATEKKNKCSKIQFPVVLRTQGWGFVSATIPWLPIHLSSDVLKHYHLQVPRPTWERSGSHKEERERQAAAVRKLLSPEWVSISGPWCWDCWVLSVFRLSLASIDHWEEQLRRASQWILHHSISRLNNICEYSQPLFISSQKLSSLWIHKQYNPEPWKRVHGY